MNYVQGAMIEYLLGYFKRKVGNVSGLEFMFSICEILAVEVTNLMVLPLEFGLVYFMLKEHTQGFISYQDIMQFFVLENVYVLLECFKFELIWRSFAGLVTLEIGWQYLLNFNKGF
jgi:hypothetical protein